MTSVRPWRATSRYYPRLRQRVVAAPFFKGRPFWVTEAHFDMDRHLHERALPGDGSMVEFDAVCSELACGHLDRLHPLWDMTLVHGLQGARQAVIIRIHHAVTDGTGAINSLMAFTSEIPGGPITAVPVAGAFGPPVSRMRLLRYALAELGPWLAGFFRLARSSRANAKKVKAFRAGAENLPAPGLSAYQDFTLAPFGDRRVCATASLPFEDFRRGTTGVQRDHQRRGSCSRRRGAAPGARSPEETIPARRTSPRSRSPRTRTEAGCGAIGSHRRS